MNTIVEPRTIAALRGLSLLARQLVSGALAGLHASRQPGLAREFSRTFGADQKRHVAPCLEESAAKITARRARAHY